MGPSDKMPQASYCVICFWHSNRFKWKCKTGAPETSRRTPLTGAATEAVGAFRATCRLCFLICFPYLDLSSLRTERLITTAKSLFKIVNKAISLKCIKSLKNWKKQVNLQNDGRRGGRDGHLAGHRRRPGTKFDREMGSLRFGESLSLLSAD